VEDPIAVCEIQGLYYAAKQAFALALTWDGDHPRASALMSEAAELKRRFNERFWMPSELLCAGAWARQATGDIDCVEPRRVSGIWHYR
jgi:glycogen debranching enzyme